VFETVYTLWHWCDGPREGVADYQGCPHVFVSEWNEAVDDYGDAFLLKPIDGETFRLVMEDWAIGEQWKVAVSEGRTTFDTHPASLEDRIRHEELKQLLREPLTVGPARARQANSVPTWLAEPAPADKPVGVVRLAAEFVNIPFPPIRGGYQLPSWAVRWSALA
jgi:hypothetical protein